MKKVKLFIKIIIIALMLLPLSASANTGNNIITIFKEGPLGNATAVSQEGWNKTDSVVLANVNQFPDAMCSVSYAYIKDAPILLTYKDRVDSSVLDEIKRLNAKNVYLFGGTGVLNENVESSLKNEGLNVYRLGGIDRFKTAVKAAEELRNIVQFDTVFIAYAYNFPDTLAAATFSAKKSYPVLFTESTMLNIDTFNALKSWSIKKAYILGGNGVINENVENHIKCLGITVERIGGQNRYETAIKIIKRFDDGNANGYTYVTGKSHQDALVGAAFAAKVNAPVVIYDEESVSESIKNYLQTINNNKVIYLIDNKDSPKLAVSLDMLKTFRSNNGEDEYYEAKIKDNTLNIKGKTLTGNKWAWIIIEKLDAAEEENVTDIIVPIDNKGYYNATLSLNSLNEKRDYSFTIYMSETQYGTYKSVYFGIPITLSVNNDFVFKLNKEVYRKNFEQQKIISNTNPLQQIEPVNNKEISDFSKQLTSGIDNTWDKVKVIHNWLAENIYYDYDVYTGKTSDKSVFNGESVFKTKRAVCQGYAELFNLMLHSVGIQSKLIGGYAIQYYQSWDEVSHNIPNHAWNEVYVDGRWIIIDVTWDSNNRYENGKYIKENIEYTYFDSTIESFSIDHKALEIH